MNIITDKVSLSCQGCTSQNLRSDGAVKTDDERIYFLFTCGDCGLIVPIDVEKTIATLYEATFVAPRRRKQ